MNITDQDPAADRLRPLSPGFYPLNDRILVERIDDLANDHLVSLPEIARIPSKKGVVVRVGPGKRDSSGMRRTLDVKVGDIIMFGRYTDFDDGSLVIIQEGDIVGIVT